MHSQKTELFFSFGLTQVFAIIFFMCFRLLYPAEESRIKVAFQAGRPHLEGLLPKSRSAPVLGRSNVEICDNLRIHEARLVNRDHFLPAFGFGQHALDTASVRTAQQEGARRSRRFNAHPSVQCRIDVAAWMVRSSKRHKCRAPGAVAGCGQAGPARRQTPSFGSKAPCA